MSYTSRTYGRQSGKTYRAIRDAPRDAIYIWPVANSIDYVERAARVLNREDIRFLTPSKITHEYLAGTNGPYVVDHACYLTPEQRHILTIRQNEGTL